MADLGQQFVAASFKSKKEGDAIFNELDKALKKMNRKIHTLALKKYQALLDRLVTASEAAILVSSMDNLERLSSFMPDLEPILNLYRVEYRQVYMSFRKDLFGQMADKEARLMTVMKKMNVTDDRVTIDQPTLNLLDAINENMYRNIENIMVKWRNYVYDLFFAAITQNWRASRLIENWTTPEGYLKIGSSLEGMTEVEASMAAVAERTTYLQENAKRNGYTFCWNVNPMDQRTKPDCIQASLAGVIPEEEMGTNYGFPPRFVCRCEIAYTRGEWSDLNKSINKEISKVRIRLIDELKDAPKQKSSWERIVGGKSTTVTPKDPERASGEKMYKDIEKKLATAEGMTVPEFRFEGGVGGL